MLSADEIRTLVKEAGLIIPGITPPDAWVKRCDNIEGSAFDLSLDGVFTLDGGDTPQIGVKYRVTPKVTPLPTWQYAAPGEEWWQLYPGGYYLFTTQESLSLPTHVAGFLDGRTTPMRCGLDIIYGPVHPGYHGILTLGVKVVGNLPILIERGARFITCRFLTIKSSGAVDAYAGPWQGGKLSSDGEAIRAH